ncbi:MAG TPA: hypothetical protein VI386_04280, partial [Candidatus Sulfotelmatobacter sp.]
QPRYLVDLLPEVHSRSSNATFHRLLARHTLTDAQCEFMLGHVEDRGSAYLPQINAFYVQEFKMASAAEDATRFLHQACQGLPRRLNGKEVSRNGLNNFTIDEFYARVIEDAVAYFGSAVLCPSKTPLPEDEQFLLSRTACEKAAQAAVRGERAKFESTAKAWGCRIGAQIYDAYLAGRVTKSGLRRLFLAHLNEPGLARKVCIAVMAKIRSASKS